MDAYSIDFARTDDIDQWMQLVELVKADFPGLDIESYRQTLIKNINRQTAICARQDGGIVGILLFSYRQSSLSCMAVHPRARRQGVASAMIEKMLALLPQDADICVTTFRAGDEKGIAPRLLYKKFGFTEGELLEEFNYPLQRFVLHRRINS
jgi:ribosomal protein S18 acetylase RimI-like enzyme